MPSAIKYRSPFKSFKPFNRFAPFITGISPFQSFQSFNRFAPFKSLRKEADKILCLLTCLLMGDPCYPSIVA